jgi:phospholipid transport system substrate-binding protein
MKNIVVIIYCFIFMFSGTAYSNDGSGAIKTELDSVRSFADENAQKVLKIVEAGESTIQIEKRLKSLFFEIVDDKLLARLVMGRNWKILQDSNKKDEYLRLYSEYLANIYVRSFVQYNDNQYKITGVKALSKKGDFLVDMDITVPNNSNSMKISYRIRNRDAKMKIVDIIAEGVSIMQTQRSEFDSIINSKKQNKTSGIDSLLSVLRLKNDSFKK